MTLCRSTARTLNLSVAVASGCTLACSYCPQDHRAGRRMSWPTLEAALELLDPSDGKRPSVCFTGGEALLERTLIERAVGWLEERFGRGGVELSLFTNGTLLDDATLEYLDEHRFEVQLSVDGGEAAQELRATGSWPGVEELLGRLARRHPRLLRDRLAVAMVVTSANLEHLADSVEALVRRGVREIRAGACYTHDPGWHAALEPELERQLDRIAALCRRHLARGEPAPFAPFRRTRAADERRDPDAPVCRAADTGSLAIGPDGEVAACLALVNLARPETRSMVEARLAALQPGPVDAPGFAQRLAAFPARLAAAGFPPTARERYSSRKRCADCDHLGLCRICPVDAGWIPGNDDPRRVPDLPCAFVDHVLTRRAAMPPTPTVADLLRGVGELECERRAVERAARSDSLRESE